MKKFISIMAFVFSLSSFAEKIEVQVLDKDNNEIFSPIILNKDSDVNEFLNEIKKPEYSPMLFRFKGNEVNFAKKGGDGGDDG